MLLMEEEVEVEVVVEEVEVVVVVQGRPALHSHLDARESVWERGSCVCPVAAVLKLSS